ncbi:DUF5908 family protein [Fluviicola sp.]|uniref:DUF5908 family protein n=1 Tax=Fluviicola sp. TaxID=1917219 RepID=UPI0031DD9919
MPIEIKELHVKIQVNEDQPKSNQTPAQATDDLLDQCMDEVFTIINDKKER